jgi:UDP-2,4-diacetamido-2,4,6-trideoxy-beta-L-altropyranose hydrolase
MNVVFRTDASLAIGTGHVMRCLTLASALRERDVDVFFVCREHDGHLCGLIEERGFTVFRLPVAEAGTQVGVTPVHADWLGATWPEDAEQTRSAIEAASVKPDWLVIDHYALDKSWECTFRSSVGHIMVIDDLADRAHDCDLLLDQNLVAQMHTRYADKVPATCSLLLGPEYALLQPLYAELHDRVPARKGPIRRMFIFFGGADSDNFTSRSLAAFLQLNRPDIEVDVVTSAGSPHAAIIRDQVAGHGNIHLHSNLPTLAPLMAKADLAMGAGGATSWERLCLGLPALVVTLAENQRSVAIYLHEAGLVHWIGHKEQVDQQIIANTLVRTLSMDSLIDWSRRCAQICTGRGVSQILNSMKIVSGETGGILCSAKTLQQ